MRLAPHVSSALIESSEQIKILYAVESGNRGWGFESKDSDYDIRFIYAHPLDWYLSIEDKKDVIEYLCKEIASKLYSQNRFTRLSF